MDSQSIIIALLLTTFAGLSTAIGAAIAYFFKEYNHKTMSMVLGISAGVMIYISFMEMLPEAKQNLVLLYGETTGEIILTLTFFIGIAFIAIIDFLIPSDENPHEAFAASDIDKPVRLKRTGIMIALSIGIHNFPEGIAAFTSALNNIEIGVAIAIAIAIHNIPEGIAVFVPVYYSTGDRKKAFKWAVLSGLAEPIGAIFAALILMPFWTPTIHSIVLAFASGIMVFISIDELLPSAERFGFHHSAIFGVIIGMTIMALTLIIL